MVKNGMNDIKSLFSDRQYHCLDLVDFPSIKFYLLQNETILSAIRQIVVLYITTPIKNF